MGSKQLNIVKLLQINRSINSYKKLTIITDNTNFKI